MAAKKAKRSPQRGARKSVRSGAEQGERRARSDAALQTAPVSFSLGWAARESEEPLAGSLDRADLHMYAVRVEARSGDRR